MRVAGQIVTPDGVVEGWVEVAGDRIAEVTPDPTLHSGHWIVPGFVDLHVHGGGGHSFTTGDAESARAAAAFHLAHGTTTLLASLVSSPYELMLDATHAFVPLVEEGILAGIHFEGPYLSHARCGAQNPAYLRAPSIAEIEGLIDAGDGRVSMMTIAPELPGALEAIGVLAAHGVLAAIGHTDATYEQARAGIEAGASVGTHVFNGMAPPHHRHPGPVFALLGSEDVICELVADGVHLHDGTLHFAATAVGPARAALVTDAIDATGMADGRYTLGGLDVEVAGGAARLVEGGSIAGSTLTMDAALRRAVGAGIPLVDAVAMAATTPAQALRRDDIGALLPGRRADLVELDEDLQTVRVLR
ncbi:MAG TPA: N-acetylglucosamine-6-phosphate deacetylase, partial [Rugosimonospora sp.]|nr:N-acetylglucosamine-6-phosphate deacetylase [Rugosimonospora sp.]